MTRLLAATLLAVLAAGTAHAQHVSNVTGVTLMKSCTGPKPDQCDAYLDGFGDAITAGGKDHALACIPQASTGTELRDVLVKFLKDHPEDQHLKATLLATRAFSKAYPCRK